MSVPMHESNPRQRAARIGRRPRRLVALLSVVGILAVAGFIGSHEGGDRPDQHASAEAGGDAVGPAIAPATTIAPATDKPSSGDSSSRASASDDDAVETAATASGEVATSGSGSGGTDSSSPSTGAGADLGGTRIDAKIVRTGSVEVELGRGGFDRAYARLTTLANGSGGFVSASQTTALDETPQGTVTLRIPVGRFDQVLTQVRKLGKVTAITTGSDDVSGEYSDVSARIHALQAERDQINLVLGKANTIPDILSVRDRLTVVQGELEQLQGRKQVLDDQTSLSTLTVALREKGSVTSVTVAPPKERTGFGLLWHDSVDRFADGGRSIALGLAAMLPWLLLALVLFLPARAIWRRGTTDPGPSTPSPAGQEA